MNRETYRAVVRGIVALALIGGGVWYFSRNTVPAGMYDAFAQCLREKQVTMYGAKWCTHCQNEKRAFGTSFRYVPYVECPAEPQRCLAAGINGYPTWIFPNGERLEGEQGLEKLSEASGCPLPKK